MQPDDSPSPSQIEPVMPLLEVETCAPGDTHATKAWIGAWRQSTNFIDSLVQYIKRLVEQHLSVMLMWSNSLQLNLLYYSKPRVVNKGASLQQKLLGRTCPHYFTRCRLQSYYHHDVWHETETSYTYDTKNLGNSKDCKSVLHLKWNAVDFTMALNKCMALNSSE